MILLFMLVSVFFTSIESKSVQSFTMNSTTFVTKDYVDERLRNLTDLVASVLVKEPSESFSPVFFHVKMEYADITYNKNSIVKFKDVLYNEGKHFFPGDSIFIAPISGVYLFSWTIQSYTGKTSLTELRVANTVKERIAVNLGSTVTESFTRVVICKVEKGQHVWIQTGSSFTDNYFYSGYSSNSSFMGVLLFKT